ncbi:unnamed protein product [Cylindrotheca closterium]|uniref:Uncharacterized protein n=1 Tax=Cylindrotheca closterium TaxID=2856 RepID=A0AAD2FCZ4_9STRA|nr:unnamed protein product [Cylindrotheca closterium]
MVDCMATMDLYSSDRPLQPTPHFSGHLWIPSVSLASTSRQHPFYLPRHFNPDLPPLPVDAVGALVFVFPSRSPIHKSRVLLHSTGPHLPAKPPAPPTSFLDLWHHFGSLAESGSHSWVPEVITIEGSEDRLAQALLAGSLCAVSDGSYKAKVGTACAQILTEDCRDIIWITCQTPGKFEDQSSRRSKLIGLMASLLVLGWISQVAHLKLFASQPSVEMACDGLIALDKASPSPTSMCHRLVLSLIWPPPSGPCFATFPSKFIGAMLKATWTSTSLSPNWTGGSSAMWKWTTKHSPIAAC